jgi:hypothetical protein
VLAHFFRVGVLLGRGNIFNVNLVVVELECENVLVLFGEKVLGFDPGTFEDQIIFF